MVVASGQMPYDYGTPLPIRALPNAWPGIGTPNIGSSGNIIEQAMFVYNAELRKWNFPDQLNLLQYQLYTHPDIASSGFEPKANGNTLEGLVGNVASIISVDNIEQMRTQLNTHLFDFYADDSEYSAADFFQSWIQTAYADSPSGTRHIIEVNPLPIFSITNSQFLRPPAEHITGGDFIDIDIHWLGGSGVLFDIDCGEVIFNPFPFPGQTNFTSVSTGGIQFEFGPVFPLLQTTAGAIPSLEVSRYESDIEAGDFKTLTNFNALNSGVVQIDGYVLLPETTLELVKGNDSNVISSMTNDYTGHVEGLRVVRDATGDNDPSARGYRTPSAQPSGLYRFLTQNQKSDVSFTAIPSGFVSIWPQGRITFSDTGVQGILSNFIDGQQTSVTTNGGLILTPASAKGIHVMDDAIWIAGPGTGAGSPAGSGTFSSRGLHAVSPHTGSLVWYRPAERILATSGNVGGDPGHWGAHTGLEFFNSDTEILRVSKTASQFIETNIGIPTANSDRVTFSINFQAYDTTTLDHREINVQYAVVSESIFGFPSAGVTSLCCDGTSFYISSTLSTLHRFTSSLAFDGVFVGPSARRRHALPSTGDLLYTGLGLTGGDPLNLLGVGQASGIGRWSISAEPSPSILEGEGSYTHDSAKRLRAETHFGHRAAFGSAIHHIFEVTGSTHVRNGIWMTIQFQANLFLCRISEGASEWNVVESMQIRDTLFTGGSAGDDYPYECILHDID